MGRISPNTWNAMEVFLASLASEEYESMASALVEMGATSKVVDSNAFAKDLEKIFSSIKVSNLFGHFLSFYSKYYWMIEWCNMLQFNW